MPLYEFKCPRCGEEAELLMRLNDTAKVECPHCAGIMEKQMSTFNFRGFFHWFKRDDWGQNKTW